LSAPARVKWDEVSTMEMSPLREEEIQMKEK
jgi:hypothetical protein